MGLTLTRGALLLDRGAREHRPQAEGPVLPAVWRRWMDDQLWRGLSLLRVLALAWAALQLAWIHGSDEYDHPFRGWAVIGAMAVWTYVSGRMLASGRGRTQAWLSVDLVVSVLLMCAMVTVDDDAFAVAERSLPAVWAVVPALAITLLLGIRWGLLAAAVVVAASAFVRGSVTGTVVANGVLAFMAVAVIGLVARLSREAEAERAAAAELRARAAERRRIGRAVHDGVLQVLAQVARTGPSLGPDGERLAVAASEQEIALRKLIAADVHEHDLEEGDVDLAVALATRETTDVTVSPPAAPVVVDAVRGQEVLDAVDAALANVRRHAPGAHAWVLLEDDGDELRVVVRDDGPGFDVSRLDEARAEGRLGVAQSIRGRVEELGGTATVTSSPGAGAVVEIVVPRGSRG